MNPIDIAVVVIILLSAILAFFRGFVREFLSIAALVVAVIVAVAALPMAEPWVRQYLDMPPIDTIIAAAGVFLIALVILSVISHFIAKLVENSAVTPIDRSLGLLFGLLRGAVLVCVAYLLLLWFFPPPNQPDWMQEARTRPAVERGTQMLVSLVPPTVIDNLMARADAMTGRELPTPGGASSPGGGGGQVAPLRQEPEATRPAVPSVPSVPTVPAPAEDGGSVPADADPNEPATGG